MTNLREQDVVPSLPSYRFIPLTKGLVAVVDAEDYDYLNQWRWYARRSKDSRYACRRDNETRCTVTMHTAIFPTRRGRIVDHRSGNGLDNRRLNLRYVTYRQNNLNRRLTARNRSGQIGITFNKYMQRWKAFNYTRKGVRIHLGYFVEKADAIAARVAAEKRYYRGFRVREDIPCPTPPPGFQTRPERRSSTGHKYIFRTLNTFWVRIGGTYVGSFSDELSAVAARDAFISSR